MASPGFDRTAFVRRQQRPERPPGPPLLGILLFVVVAILVAFGGYKYIEANGMPALGDAGGSNGSPTPNPDLAQIASKLEEIEQRLARLERRGASAPASAEPQASSNLSSSPRPYQPSSTPSGARRAISSQTLDPAEAKRLAELQRKYGSLEAGLQADRERWDATTDRVAGTVTELGEQRSTIADTREKVNQLWERFERESVPFNLQKGSEKQRVGPVWLWLRKTDRKNHRYTMRVFADDKWIELKDRALLEPVELYLAEVPVAFQLVVTQIDDDAVSGVLGVPRQLPPR